MATSKTIDLSIKYQSMICIQIDFYHKISTDLVTFINQNLRGRVILSRQKETIEVAFTPQFLANPDVEFFTSCICVGLNDYENAFQISHVKMHYLFSKFNQFIIEMKSIFTKEKTKIFVIKNNVIKLGSVISVVKRKTSLSDHLTIDAIKQFSYKQQFHENLDPIFKHDGFLIAIKPIKKRTAKCKLEIHIKDNCFLIPNVDWYLN